MPHISKKLLLNVFRMLEVKCTDKNGKIDKAKTKAYIEEQAALYNKTLQDSASSKYDLDKSQMEELNSITIQNLDDYQKLLDKSLNEA